MGCGSSKATPIVPTPQRLLLPIPDGDAPESVVSRSVSVGKQLSLVDGKYARCEIHLDNSSPTELPALEEIDFGVPSAIGAPVARMLAAAAATAGRRRLKLCGEIAPSQWRTLGDADAVLVRGDEVLIDLGDDDGK